MRERFGKLGTGAAALGAGLLLVFAGLLVLLQAAVYGLAPLLDSRALAALLVGATALALGVGSALVGRREIKAEELVPRRTLENLRQDVEVVTGGEGDRYDAREGS
jgi:hypothetical protein